MNRLNPIHSQVPRCKGDESRSGIGTQGGPLPLLNLSTRRRAPFFNPRREISSSVVQSIMRREQPNLLRPLHPRGREQTFLNGAGTPPEGATHLNPRGSVESAGSRFGPELGRSGRSAVSFNRLFGHEQQ